MQWCLQVKQMGTSVRQ